VEGAAREIAALNARRWRVALVLSVAMVVVYLGFVLLIAFAKPLLARPVLGAATLGIVLGVLVILSAWLLTFAYVAWANRRYDPPLAELRERARG
jgi:uncharacterized membrane protein (DUF485 family)